MREYRFLALMGVISLIMFLAGCQHETGTISGRVLDQLTNQPLGRIRRRRMEQRLKPSPRAFESRCP